MLDVGLPGISGHEVARALRQQPGGAALRIIGVTGWGQAEDRRRTREAGFDLHLVKPVDPEQLLRVVAEGARPAAAAEPAATVTAID